MVVCKHITYLIGLSVPRCFLQSHPSLLSSPLCLQHWGMMQKCHWFPPLWAYPWVPLSHLFTKWSYHFPSWLPDFKQLFRTFAISFTVLYEVHSKYFLALFFLLACHISWVFLIDLLYFAVMSKQINTHFLKEWISKLREIESSLNTSTFEGLKLK